MLIAGGMLAAWVHVALVLFAIVGAALLVVGMRGRRREDARSFARRSFERLGLSAPSAWTLEAVEQHVDELQRGIAGPGNRWVTAAKQIVGGTVGIDMLAGPSELLIIADESAEADLVAADL